MLYICSKQDTILDYWTKEFQNRYVVKSIELDFFEFDRKLNKEDIFILDVDQFDNVEETLEYFNKLSKNINTLALLEEPKLAHGAYLVKKGFKSYIGKKTSKLIIQQALQTVVNGDVWLYPQLMNYIIKHINVNHETTIETNSLDQLSAKEQNVASLVAQGLSNKEIASNLDIQLVTVKKHISSIFNKLNIKDRVALAILINSQ